MEFFLGKIFDSEFDDFFRRNSIKRDFIGGIFFILVKSFNGFFFCAKFLGKFFQ